MDIDVARARMEELASEWKSSEDQVVTEQDARFRVIDLILTEVLGWSRTDIKTEPHTDSGFVDYLVDAGGNSRMVVEAKRTSADLVDTRLSGMSWYKVGGPAVQSAREGLEQAKRYCTDTATLFCALTNGFQWIGFWAVRTDGVRPSEGRAAVFPSIESVMDRFALFYDLFSREGIERDLYRVHIHEAEGLQIQRGEPLTSITPTSDIHLIPKSALASDLEVVFRRFFSSISGDDDPEMLAKCFVESKESREADDNLEKITRSLLNSVDVVDAGKGSRLQEEIQLAVESGRGEFVLIIGNKGAGKTTFIDRFFRLVLDTSLRRRCLLVRVNLADSSGDSESIGPWLTNRLRDELERELFGGEHPSYEQLQGIFFREYDRWRVGERKFLYQRNKDEFKERFGEWVAELVDREPDKYVRRLLESAIRLRKLMPCLVFDNTDHFPQRFQEAVFQFAQSLYRSVFAFVICPITDRTIWQLSKAGPFQSYESRALYLPVPSTKEVLAKRIAFLKEKASTEQSGRYFMEKGIRVAIRDIDAFASSIEDVFINEEYIGRIVGWLSNHDIRRSLRIAERIITSPTITVGELVRAYVGGRSLRPRARQIKLALLRGQHNHFLQDGNDFVLNLFEIRSNQITSPLLRLSILRLLIDRQADSEDSVEAYLRTRDIINYFEPLGVSGGTISDHLQALLDYRLVEPYDPTEVRIADELLVKVTYAGRIHYEFVFSRNEASYLSEMALTTPVRGSDYIELVRDRMSQPRPLAWQDWQRIQEAFVRYCLAEDRLFLAIPSPPSYDGQRLLRAELALMWNVGEESGSAAQLTLGE